MKLLKKSALTLAALALSTAYSSAAITLTFKEVNGDVIMSASGTIDLLPSAYGEDIPVFTPVDLYRIGSNNTHFRDSGFPMTEQFRGTVTPMSNVTTTGEYVSGSGYFSLDTEFGLYVLTNTPENDDQDVTSLTSDLVVKFVGTDFATMGLNQTTDQLHTLFQLEGTNSEDNRIQFILDTTPVPEPSAALLGGIGVLTLLRRRRK